MGLSDRPRVDDPDEVIVRRRLRAQHLTGAPFGSPTEAVAGLLAVQAQDYEPAKWSIGMRVRDGTDARIERAFAAGELLRTHVLRPTWHFVLPVDIRWLLTATAPRVRVRMGGRLAQLGLDAETMRRSSGALGAALRGGGALTRAEAAAVLSGAGVDITGQRLPHLLMCAELDGLVCSGPRRGKQHTWMLLEERAPGALDLPRNEALAELARRYFAGHGPATEKDLAGWASLTLGEVRAAIEVAGPALLREEVGSRVLWSAPGSAGHRVPALRSPVVRLVQGYDEYVMGYSETKGLLARPGSAWAPATPPVFALVMLLDGRVAGFWRRTVRRDAVLVEVAPLAPLDGDATAALEAEAARYGVYLGLDAAVRLQPPLVPGSLR